MSEHEIEMIQVESINKLPEGERLSCFGRDLAEVTTWARRIKAQRVWFFEQSNSSILALAEVE